MKPMATGLRWAFNEVTKRSANRMKTGTAATGHCDIAGAAARTIEPRQPSAPAARPDGADRLNHGPPTTDMRRGRNARCTYRPRIAQQTSNANIERRELRRRNWFGQRSVDGLCLSA